MARITVFFKTLASLLLAGKATFCRFSYTSTGSSFRRLNILIFSYLVRWFIKNLFDDSISHSAYASAVIITDVRMLGAVQYMDRIDGLVLEARSLLKGKMRVLAARELLLAVAVGLTGGLDSLFVKEVLGADAVVLGTLVSIWSAVFLMFILLGGWISDRYDQKLMLLAGMALTLPNPIMLALALHWRVFIVANFLGALGSALATPAYVALLFSFSEQSTRSRSIAVMNTLTSLANTIVPPLGALAIQTMGGLNEIRRIFLVQFVLSVGVWGYTAKALRSGLTVRKAGLKSLKDSVKEIFGQMNTTYRISKERKATSWLFLALTGPWAWEIAGPFWIIYAAEVCGSSLSILGLLPAVYSLTAAVLLLPLANVSDRTGRKKVIILGRPFLYACIMFLLLGGTFRDWKLAPLIPIAAWILRAIGDASGPSWTAASTEVIPEEFQSEWEATRDFLWRVMTIPAGIMSGFLWNVDPRLPFATALLVDGMLRFPALIYLIPETLIVHRHPNVHPRPSGPHIVVYGLPGSGQTSIAHLVQKEMQAELVDESIVQEHPRRIFRAPLHIRDGDDAIERKVTEILNHEQKPIVIEGRPALFAAKASDKATVVLLVASREERVRRESEKMKAPEFVVLKEVQDKDREISRLTHRLYGADISKLPPFDVAINTERVRPEKVAKIIEILREGSQE